MIRYALLSCLLTILSLTAWAQNPVSTNRPGSLNGTNPAWAPFYHGVASGDPLEDRVIIWTRITPNDNAVSVSGSWVLATDTALTQIVKSGNFSTAADKDYTVKIDVTGLQPGTTYYYGFKALGKSSLTGRTKTTPKGEGVKHLRFGVVSCSNYQAGYFNAYGNLAKRNDLDAILHLGDYIYEYGEGAYGNASLAANRKLSPENEIVSLEDYRIRYSTYRLDTHLIRAHQQHPFIAVWDDHESANDAYKDGAQNHSPATEGTWSSRLQASKKAYFEWLPIRDNSNNQVYRNLHYGDLVDLIMLDTRIEGRNKQIDNVLDTLLQDTARTLLGNTQKEWFLTQLKQSKARWKVIGQQVIFSQFNVGFFSLQDPRQSFNQVESLFLDIWDGYPAERKKLIDYIASQKINNVVILTGDFHSSFAFDVADEPVKVQFQNVPGAGTLPFHLAPAYVDSTGKGSVAVEFATPSVTSANFDENIGLPVALAVQFQINKPILAGGGALNLGNPNPHMKYNDLTQHGYLLLDVTPEKAQGEWYFCPIDSVSTKEQFAAGYYSNSTVTEPVNHLLKASAASAGKTNQDAPAPANPPGLLINTFNVESLAGLTIIGIYPNPTEGQHKIHFSLDRTMPLSIELLDETGKVLRKTYTGTLSAGTYVLDDEASIFPAGAYFYRFMSEQGSKTYKILRK